MKYKYKLLLLFSTVGILIVSCKEKKYNCECYTNVKESATTIAAKKYEDAKLKCNTIQKEKNTNNTNPLLPVKCGIIEY